MKFDFYNVWDENIETEYLYDDNGNQYADLNKGIAWIKYNLLNLPEKIQFQNGEKTEYLYDASGVKRQAKWAYGTANPIIPLGDVSQEVNNVTVSRTTEYCGNYIYEQGQIKRILTPEGYITTNSWPVQYMSQWCYNYSLKDYQGNTRQTLTGNKLSGSQNVLFASGSTVDYYPFGMEMTTPEGWYTSGSNPYLYNGKEIDRMHGLNQYDYGARWRDGALPAWTTVDPLAEKYYSISPYAYCANNPVLFVDPDGRDWYKSEDGNSYVWHEGSNKIDNYENIGATFQQKIDNNTTLSFTQNEVTSITTNTMSEDKWVSQYDSRFGNSEQQSKACNKASDAMLSNAGVSSKGMEVIVANAGSGRAGNANSKSSEAINNMSSAIEQGKPTKVNVDFRSGTGSADGMGDHFFVVQGKTEMLNNGQVTSTTFHYFDPGTRHQSKGTSPSNTIRVENGRLIGYHINKPNTQVIVTSIRPTR